MTLFDNISQFTDNELAHLAYDRSSLRSVLGLSDEHLDALLVPQLWKPVFLLLELVGFILSQSDLSEEVQSKRLDVVRCMWDSYAQGGDRGGDEKETYSDLEHDSDSDAELMARSEYMFGSIEGDDIDFFDGHEHDIYY